MEECDSIGNLSKYISSARTERDRGQAGARSPPQAEYGVNIADAARRTWPTIAAGSSRKVFREVPYSGNYTKDRIFGLNLRRRMHAEANFWGRRDCEGPDFTFYIFAGSSTQGFGDGVRL